MDIKSDDSILVENLIKYIPKISKQEVSEMEYLPKPAIERVQSLNFESPIDTAIMDKLKELLPLTSDNNLYSKVKDLKSLWYSLVDKSIKCLRYFDAREPYLEIEHKVPQSYGIDDLVDYYEEFANFEALLYGSNQFYRDHVIHLFRTWLIGLNILSVCPKTL